MGFCIEKSVLSRIEILFLSRIEKSVQRREKKITMFIFHVYILLKVHRIGKIQIFRKNYGNIVVKLSIKLYYLTSNVLNIQF